jgi:hypothetical protein
MFVFALSLSAFADPVALHTAARNGLSGEDLLAAPNPVPVASFTYQKIEWTLACKGAVANLRCELRGGHGGAVTGGDRSVVHLRLGDHPVDLTVERSPVSFEHVRALGT